MMGMSRRQTAEDREERRTRRAERETYAGTLLAKVPDLVVLDIAVHESRPGGCYDSRYIRRVVVSHAAALFELACTQADCEDGGYDITREVLASLAAHRTRFEGEQSCRGRGKVLDCTQVLRCVATAKYREARDSGAHGG